MNRARSALGVAIVVALGATAGYLASQRLRSGSGALRATPAVNGSSGNEAIPGSGAPATAAAEGAPAAPVAIKAIPEVLPDLHMHDLGGRLKSLREFGGRPLIVNFWATWCAPCRREIPLLHQLRRQYAGDRLEIVGIAIDFHAAVADYVAKTKIDYPLLVGEQDGLDAAQQFGMEPVLPFSVFADRSGTIVAVKIGELHREEADYILAAIRKIDAGSLPLPQARAAIAQRLKQLAIERAQHS